MASAFSDCLITSGGDGNTPLISQKTTKGMFMKFLPHVGTHMEAQNQKFLNKTSRHPNFTKLSTLTSERNPENFRSISQRLALLQNYL